MTCGWCGGSIASANKPHTKGECEMSELTHRANTHMGNCKYFSSRDCNCGRNESAAELKSMQAKAAKYDALEQAARDAVENAVFYDPECDDCMGVADGENHSHECLVIKLSNLLDGE